MIHRYYTTALHTRSHRDYRRAVNVVDFESQIRPLLKQYCVTCHGPTKTG